MSLFEILVFDNFLVINELNSSPDCPASIVFLFMLYEVIKKYVKSPELFIFQTFESKYYAKVQKIKHKWFKMYIKKAIL